jgi:hypothetical protein
MPGSSASRRIHNNWLMWGPKGLFTTHAAFEAGVAVLIAPLKMRLSRLNADKLADFDTHSLADWFRKQAQDIADLEMYDRFYKSGWTIPLARRVRKQLAPTLVQAVTLVWYGAVREAGLAGAIEV